MSKITFENKKDKITIINRLSYPETVNERIYNAIASGMFEGFLPISIHQKRKETRIECIAQGMIPLNNYFQGIVTKKMFLDLVHEIALQIKNCEKNMVNANNLDLQRDKIFIDPKTKSVKCIFWPIVNNQRDTSPHMFLKQLPYELNFNPHEDKKYLETYKAFFGGVNPFSVNAFDRMVLQLSGKENLSGRIAPSEALSSTIGNDAKADKKVLDLQKKANIEYDPFSTDNSQKDTEGIEKQILGNEEEMFCPACGNKNLKGYNFCSYCGEKMREDKPIEVEEVWEETQTDFGTTVLGDDSGGTTVLGYDEPEIPVFPSLKRIRTDEVFSIDKPTFRIGKEQKYCDLFIGDNTYISRSHADIITRDERYYIIDRNSTNKTYVDGKVIPIEKEIEIFPGSQIRLANEDFTFDIEE